jgi:hypothetical protein
LASHAQTAWPTPSIRFVVLFAPRGTSEIVARTGANELPRRLGQIVYVDNKGGGAGLPTMLDVAKAKPDGQRICLTGASSGARWGCGPMACTRGSQGCDLRRFQAARHASIARSAAYLCVPAAAGPSFGGLGAYATDRCGATSSRQRMSL